MDTEKPVRESTQQVAFELQESGATKWQALRILRGLEGFEGNDQALRRRAAELLEGLNPEAAKTFASFEKMRVYTSAQRLEPFDRGNIIKSLLKETNVSRHVAEKIGGEVEDRIKDMKIGYLNTHIIREMVNVRLLEYGHEAVHNQYARIGMPVYEVKKRLDAGALDINEILGEYNWLTEIPPKARELHFEGFVHVHAPQDFSSRMYSASRFLSGTMEDIAAAAKKTDEICTLPLTIAAFNFSCVSAGKTAKKAVDDRCASLGKLFSLTGKSRQVELALYLESAWQEYASRKNEAMWFANALLRSSSAAFIPYLSLNSRYQLKLVEKKNQTERLFVANCQRERNKPFGDMLATGTKEGIMQAVSLNLAKIAENSFAREEVFFRKLEEVCATTSEVFSRKREVIAKRPYFEKWMADETTDVICLLGLSSTASAIAPESPSKIAERIIGTFQNQDITVSSGNSEAAARFGVSDDRAETQRLLLSIGAKARKSYGFAYSAETMKQAEQLLEDCPFVVLQKEKDAQQA